MNDTLQLFRRAYRSTRSYAGNFHSFPEILEEFNRILSADYSGEVTADELRDAVKACYPRAAFNPEYTDRASGNTFEAVRIFFSNAENQMDRKAAIAERQTEGYEATKREKILPSPTPAEIDTLREQVADALLRSFPDSNGNFLMTTVVPALRRCGLDIKSLGYPSLKDFMNIVFNGMFVITDVGTMGHPKMVLHLGDPNEDFDPTVVSSRAVSDNGKTVAPQPREPRPYYNETATRPARLRPRPLTRAPEGHDRAFNRIKRFALIFSFKNMIRQLSGKALPEQWYYGTKDPGTCPVLNSYFLETFDHICTMDEAHADDPAWVNRLGIRDTDGRFHVNHKHDVYLPAQVAVFNTGLVDREYDPIYAVFYTNPVQGEEKSPWVFFNFVTPHEREEYAALMSIFDGQLPPRAHYYNSTAELCFEPSLPVASYNWDHIAERIDRLPLDFIDELNLDVTYDPLYPETLSAVEESLRSNPQAMELIKERISEATTRALKRACWDYRTVIPVYHNAKESISLLLPLALVDPRNVDTVLVLEKTGDTYHAHTIYTIEMAYRSARLIGRPEVSWLSSRRIRPALWVSPSNIPAQPATHTDFEENNNDD